jgi:hypothetical protein
MRPNNSEIRNFNGKHSSCHHLCEGTETNPSVPGVSTRHNMQTLQRRMIKLTVGRLLRRLPPDPDLRHDPRDIFVRPARIIFTRPGSEFESAVAGGGSSDAGVTVDVVMTDISWDGAGILIYGTQEALPPRVTLIIDGSAFDCEVRWSANVGSQVSRYGLKFHDVRDSVAVQRR